MIYIINSSTHIEYRMTTDIVFYYKTTIFAHSSLSFFLILTAKLFVGVSDLSDSWINQSKPISNKKTVSKNRYFVIRDGQWSILLLQEYTTVDEPLLGILVKAR